VRNIGRTATDVRPIGAGSVCGAALYVSADTGSVMAGGALAAPSPVPSIPDVFVVIYEHVPFDDDSPSQPVTAW